MSKEELDGVWRTVRGRRIFIKKGESLGEAMSRSGKFKREDIRESRQEKRLEDTLSKRKYVGSNKRNKLDNKYVRTSGYDINEKDNIVEKNRINENAKVNENAKTRVERNKEKYSDTDKRELRHEKLQKKLADYKSKKQSNNKIVSDFENGAINEEETLKRFNNDKELANKTFKEMGYKSPYEQSNNKTESEYELYKRAKESPETIDAMTENSTDWEALDKKYSQRYEVEHRFETAKEIAKELNPSMKNASDTLLEKRAKELMQYTDGEVLENGEKPYKNEKGEIERSTQYLDDWLKDLKSDSEEKFVQNTNMYGGTREYSKEQLDKMAEQGIRPMKNSYTGGGWEGVNSKQNLSTSEQAKAITSEMKKQFPDVKIARSSQNYSGGSSIDFNIMSSDKDLYITDKDIDNLGNEQLFNTDITRGWGFERWAKENVPSYREEQQYSVDDVKRYAKEQLKNMKAHDNQNVSGDEWYLSDYGKKVVSSLNKEANSYTFDDSDGTIDYFHHGTYMNISIGKWNKPYEVNDTKAKVDAFKKRKGK